MIHNDLSSSFQDLDQWEGNEKQIAFLSFGTGKNPTDLGINSHDIPTILEETDRSESSDSEYKSSIMRSPGRTTNKKNGALPKQRSRRLIMLLGIVIMDACLLLTLSLYAVMCWIHHVHGHYLLPQLRAVEWTDDRAEEEITYFARFCDFSDMSTTTGGDLFLPQNATVDDAYDHQLTHGFTIFKHVLQPATAHNLREYISAKNRNLKPWEEISLIQQKNRYSFGLGTEVPAVVTAAMEVANHERLRPAIEKVLGPNPALVEMTAITSSYGARAQHWHEDVVPHASVVRYARAFGPLYSVFIVLQNTTKEMGATGACPGTHFCSNGDTSALCEENGFEVVDHTGIWEAGDALLMNMNSVHRGSAHVDPSAPDRVMFIVSFASRPETRAETRQMSLGFSYSLRWDMWGHTLEDLARADTAMKQPWATLRSLGLYKPSNAAWGVDYISSSSTRIANDEFGFRRADLLDFVKRGGISWLPKFLQADVGPDDGFYEFLYNTGNRCLAFTRACSLLLLGSYLIATCFYATRSFPSVGSTPFRAVLCVMLTYGLYWGAVMHVDKTDWATDILSNFRYGSVTEAEKTYSPYDGISTFPNRLDVLVETRYGSRQFAMYNDFINYHPGNKYFRKVVRDLAQHYRTYSDQFRKATALYIKSFIDDHRGRFLHQGPDGEWFHMDENSKIQYIEKELLKNTSPLLLAMATECRFLVSEYKYGYLRKTALAIKHAVPNMMRLEEMMLFRHVGSTVSVDSSNHRVEPTRHSLVRNTRSKARHQRRLARLSTSVKLVEPHSGAWLSEGDVAEGYVKGNWYYGHITFIDAHGSFSMSYPDGDSNVVDPYELRPFVPYVIGEELQVLLDALYHPCQIIGVHGDGYEVWLKEENVSRRGFGFADFRRYSSDVQARAEYKAAY